MHMKGTSIEATRHTPALRRDPVIDGLKLVAAGAIVMVHVAMQRDDVPLAAFIEQVSYSALHFFFLVAGFFHGSLGTRGPRWLGKRFIRLASPYYVWSLVFVAWWNVYHVIRGWPLYFPDVWQFLFAAGAAEVLWSLPWLLVCALIAELFVRSPLARRGLIVAAAVVQLAVWFLVSWDQLPSFAARQYVEGARWVLVYLLGMEIRSREHLGGSLRLWIATAAGASCVAGLLALVWGAQPMAPIPQIVMFCLNASVAVALLGGARAGVHWSGVASLAWGGEYLLGIYVSHGLVLAILARIVWSGSMPVLVWLPFGWLVAFGVSLLTTRLLLSSRWTRLAVT